MKIFIPNYSRSKVGGGWTFLRNITKGLENKAEFVDNWQVSDIVFIAGISMIKPGEIHEAYVAGKKIVLRVDNIPRKSRNSRNTPHERLKEIAELVDIVIYQSEWAKEYCRPLCGDGTIICNGVNQKIFYPTEKKSKIDRYFFAFHGKSELKCFWQAHYFFQMEWRKYPKDNKPEFWFIYDFGRDLQELQEAKFDFWQGEKYNYLPLAETAEDMADIMRRCTHLIYPSFADASPNLILEARACGLKIMHVSDIGGSKDLMDKDLDISLDRMCEEYLGVFKLLINN